MKLFSSLSVLFLALIACNGSGSHSVPKYDIRLTSPQKDIHLNDSIQLDVSHNDFGENVQSVTYTINAQKLLQTKENQYVVSNVKLGKQFLTADVILANGQKETVQKEITILAQHAPKIFQYRIIAEYPHDTQAYTQGLEFVGDTLIESTGQYGHSSIRKWNVFTGEMYINKPIGNSYFGEGVTALNNKIYQLTWREKIGFVYDMNLNPLKTFAYGQSQEGWGLCNDGTNLYKSDGTERIWTLDPDTLAEKDFIQLCTNQSIYSKANELEWVDGKIYANTYQRDGIMIINPENGAIEGIVDMRGLKDKVQQISTLDVLNGIAYHATRKTFFITGKNWSSVFEVVFEEK
ncbi:MAG: glutaminyl-peptide cyclotransferase [Capnocytophaga sp.]|nr:glutaminyl-peptide cyclotransferase [Capnocytophaga sp.]